MIGVNIIDLRGGYYGWVDGDVCGGLGCGVVVGVACLISADAAGSY